MGAKIRIQLTEESNNIQIEMNRAGIDFLMMNLDRLRAKMQGKYVLEQDEIESAIEFVTKGSSVSLKSLTFKLN